jgi:hypothetical protein
MISTILILIGLMILIRLHIQSTTSVSISVWFFLSIIFIFSGCVIREKKINERYGKLIAGTVYAAYPENVPGLGWIL